MAVQPVGEYEPKTCEELVLAYWKSKKVAESTLKPRKGKLFSFLEGPPTANAPPALHHVEMRTFKDVVNRFHYMLGESVPRKAGWDCHGLPVEVQVEKELKLENKKAIIEYGLDRFIEKCRQSVFSHIKEWDDLTARMGYWVDLEKPYVTMDNNYVESVWWSLKKLWDKGLLYEGYKVVPLCSRCGTPLSSHEVALGYKSVKEMTVVVALPVKDRDFSLLAWTTTPWTLISNVALAVNPKINYALIKYRGEKYVLAKDLAEKRFPEAETISEMSGKELIGLEYHPLFNHFINKLEKPAWRVIKGEFVTTEEGTGIVHIAPAFGEDDYNVSLENDLPVINPVDLDGKFTSDVSELMGVFVKEADEKIIAMLEERGSIIAKYPYEHEYPFCWRCNTPLLYYAMKSWFIKVADNVPKIVDKNSKISWYPPTIGSGRFGNWLENARDWGLSRNRFWGTPLPIWECECGKKKAIGSRKELLENAVGEVTEDIDLHRPYVDKVKLKCSCGAQMTRVEYVIDCWYDSGAAPFAQYHYPFENKKLFEESFPYDFIAEATDQTRGWFYTLLVISTLLFDKPAYKNCVVGGLLLDENGEKMSKSKNNIINPWTLFNSVGADAVRLQLCSTAPWNAKRFGVESMNETVIPMLRTLWNCYSFTVRYMLLDKFDPRESKLDKKSLAKEDEWILSCAAKTCESVKQSYLGNEYHHALSKISNFVVEDLSRWYIKLIRDRLWLEDKNGLMNPSKKAAYMSMSEVLRKTCIMLAPMAPFITEEIYLNILKKDSDSIHQIRWPKDEDIDSEIIENMLVVRAVFEAGSRCRQDAGIKLRYPIAKATISGDERVKKAVDALGDIITKQLNTKAVEYNNELPDVTYSASPNFKVIGPKYGKDAAKVAQSIKDNPIVAKKIVDSGKEAEIEGHKVSADMVLDVKMDFGGEFAAASFSCGTSSGFVLIDSRRDEKLVREALARDIIRHLQELRKKENLEELARITVSISKSKLVEEMLGDFLHTILSEVRADSINLVEGLESADKLKFDDEQITYSIKH